jgi:hypothetical protein
MLGVKKKGRRNGKGGKKVFVCILEFSGAITFFFRIRGPFLLKSFYMFPSLPHCHAFLFVFPALVIYISLLYISVLFTSIYIFILSVYIIISLRGNVATVAMGFQKVLLFEKSFLIFGRILKNRCHRCHIAMRPRRGVSFML